MASQIKLLYDQRRNTYYDPHSLTASDVAILRGQYVTEVLVDSDQYACPAGNGLMRTPGSVSEQLREQQIQVRQMQGRMMLDAFKYTPVTTTQERMEVLGTCWKQMQQIQTLLEDIGLVEKSDVWDMTPDDIVKLGELVRALIQPPTEEG